MLLARGDIVLADFPFSDLSNSKVRPALMVSPGLIGQDVVLLAISSVMRGTTVSTDLLVPVAHSEFAFTGLHIASVFRAHKLATVERKIITRRLGRVGPQLQAEIDNLLRLALML